ncbi:Rv3235 family protein [Yinghuangia soli]|uniref:Rv3235 family protein n=1 Tax=Yinghuangia soli TaxID=2908204 RepID=A0AA41U5D1_9ACTN|nr:Rv3235 family protein [Yinghuangia soli]MCF2533911.1 Rv3235 family protein [Yinghuangia soli]
MPAVIDLAAVRRTRRPGGAPEREPYVEFEGLANNAPSPRGCDSWQGDQPASTLHQLRVLRPPAWEPPYEGEPGGGLVIPFPPRPLPTPDLRLVGAPLAEPDPAEARRRVRRFAMLLAEVLSGCRAPRQLDAHTTTEVRARVDRLRRTLAERRITGVTLAAANATAPTPDTAEGFLRLRLAGPERFQAVAVRLDRTRPRSRAPHTPTWICTALRYR